MDKTRISLGRLGGVVLPSSQGPVCTASPIPGIVHPPFANLGPSSKLCCQTWTMASSPGFSFCFHETAVLSVCMKELWGPGTSSIYLPGFPLSLTSYIFMGGISWEATDTSSFKDANPGPECLWTLVLSRWSLLSHLPTRGNLPLALSWICFCSMSCKSPDP